jgi:signal transduction histidine kinase
VTDSSSEENNSTFSLKHQRDRSDGAGVSSLSWQERAYERLKTLYKISKHLSQFISVEDSIPKMLTLASESFPLLTAVLIDNWGVKTNTAIWHSEDASHDQVVKATLHARVAFSYFAGSSSVQTADLQTDTATQSELQDIVNAQKSNFENHGNYIVVPLMVDNLPPNGALQLEGTVHLNEQDLEFVDALANLIAVALDRFYKTKAERNLQEIKNKESSGDLLESKGKVTNLEVERELREGFVSLLTHDLRTPLSAAKMSAQLLLKHENDHETNCSLVDIIMKNINRTEQMVNNLLDANRIRSGEKLPLNVEHFELSSLIEETLKELSFIHGDRFLFKKHELSEGYWDPKGIRRIIENLCNNAIKYGSLNSPVAVFLEQKENDVQISIQNEGDLISDEDQKSIFQQFKRTQKADSGSKKGWGVGLTLVRGVAEAHGGSVKVKSDRRSGTIFTVSLPKDARVLPRK